MGFASLYPSYALLILAYAKPNTLNSVGEK